MHNPVEPRLRRAATPRLRQLAWLAAAGVALAFLSGCEADDPTIPTVAPPDLEIQGPETLGGIGASAAYGVNVSGALALLVQWSSSNPEVLAPGAAAGTFVARAGGSAIIRASVGSRLAEKRVTVTVPDAPPPPPSALPPALHLAAHGDTVLASLGDTLIVSATLRSSSGEQTTPSAVEWGTSDAAVAIVAGGRIVARSNGRAVITARASGVEATLAVRVAQIPTDFSVGASAYTIAGPGQSVQLQATARDRRGNAVASVPMVWSSSHPGRISVSAAGLATAASFGSATVSVRALGVTRTAAVSVRGGSAPAIEAVRAGITRVGSDSVASYAVVTLEARDAERDMDSVTVTLLDGSGVTVMRYRRLVEQGVADAPLSLHAAAANRATQARVETFDAAGNHGTRTVPLRRSPSAQSPVIEAVDFRRVGTDSLHVAIEVVDAEADVDVLWLVGFDAAGGWSFVEGFPIDAGSLREWFAEVGLRRPAVANSRSFGVVLVDRTGNLSLLHTSPVAPASAGAHSLSPSFSRSAIGQAATSDPTRRPVRVRPLRR